MSCSSCHIDGYSPDLLADTLGDGRHESPKRIPSLFHVYETGPWSWAGNKPSLDHQIRQTLVTTMHHDENPREALGSVDSITQDLVAYMSSLKVPTRSKSTDADIEHGRVLFERQKCSQCHSPEHHFTTPETYDVGVSDEQGTRKFNPPSLLGLKHRRAYFHDARFKSLDDLLKNHPDEKNALNETELDQLKAFLLSL
jgi:cytochrome c peroxidase